MNNFCKLKKKRKRNVRGYIRNRIEYLFEPLFYIDLLYFKRHDKRNYPFKIYPFTIEDNMVLERGIKEDS